MRLKLNVNKTEYIAFGSKIQLQKVSNSPLIDGNDVIQMSSNVKYLGGIVQAQLQLTHHHENKDKHVNFICIREISLQTSMHHTSTHVMYIAFGLSQCTTVWSTKEINKQIPNNTKHVC